jgi:hypothetical protein
MKIKKHKFFHHFFTGTYFSWNFLQIFQRIRNRHPILNIIDAHLEFLQKQYFRLMQALIENFSAKQTRNGSKYVKCFYEHVFNLKKM